MGRGFINLALSFLKIMCTEKPNQFPNSHGPEAKQLIRRGITFLIMISKEISSKTILCNITNKVLSNDLTGDSDKFYKVTSYTVPQCRSMETKLDN